MDLKEPTLDKIAQTGRQAALAAGALLRQNYYKPHQITLKGAIDPVTESDLAAQEIIIDLIRQQFPEHDFLAEETAEAAAGEPPAAVLPRWIIDPLDGTVNFAHGYPAFCVSIACENAGRLEYGVIYDPLREELFEARRGAGAWLNGRPIRVSGLDRLDRALVATGFPYDIRERLPATLARMGRILGQVQGLRRGGSAALDLAYVACGRFDGFYEENLKPWDTAAGLLLVEEAGGRITTFGGGGYDIYSPNILASNGVLHEKLLFYLNNQSNPSAEFAQKLKKPFYVGADGCKGGWFAIAINQEGQWQTGIFHNIETLWKKYHEASVILLDVPIGLKESGADERCCDKEARSKLGPDRGRAVFRVPCRQAVYAETYEQAKSINEQVTGKSLPVFTWGIVPKIKEVDKFLLSDKSARSCLKEIHPELCFWALARRPMQYKKDTIEGYSERFQILGSYPQAQEIITQALTTYKRQTVKKDDILDALVAAITALGPIESIPAPPELDDKGLPMQMIYRRFNKG